MLTVPWSICQSCPGLVSPTPAWACAWTARLNATSERRQIQTLERERVGLLHSYLLLSRTALDQLTFIMHTPSDLSNRCPNRSERWPPAPTVAAPESPPAGYPHRALWITMPSPPLFESPKPLPSIISLPRTKLAPIVVLYIGSLLERPKGNKNFRSFFCGGVELAFAGGCEGFKRHSRGFRGLGWIVAD